MAELEKKCMPVSSIMTVEPVCVDPNTSIKDAVRLLHDHKIRHLPVTGPAGNVRGLVSNRDMLVAHMRVRRDALYTERLVAPIMTREVDCIAPDACAYAAARYMYAHKRGCLLVVKEDLLVGILTEADFVKAFAGGSTCKCQAGIEHNSD